MPVLLEPRFADDVQAEGAVFIAQADDGKFAIDGVLDLDHLILRGGDIRDVGNDQAARNLLLDGDAGDGSLLLRGEPRDRWANAKMADAEQAFDAPAKLAGDGFGKQRGCAEAGVLPGRGALRAFFAGLSQGQERDDVARRQRRVGTVRQGEAAGGASEIERDFILTDGRGGFDVEHGIEAERIREINVAARDGVFIPAEIHFTREQVNVSEKNRMLPRAAQAQACVGLKSRAAPLHARIGTGIGFNIELQIPQVRR